MNIMANDLPYANDIKDCLIHNSSISQIEKIVVFSEFDMREFNIDGRSKKILWLKMKMDHYDAIKYACRSSKDSVIYSTPFVKFDSSIISSKEIVGKGTIYRCIDSYYIFHKSMKVEDRFCLDDILVGAFLPSPFSFKKVGYFSIPGFPVSSLGWKLSKSRILHDEYSNIKETPVVEEAIACSSNEAAENSFLSNRIDVIIVSVDYNDFLKITLDKNRKLFDNITVVTSSSDTECVEICNERGVKVVVTDEMYSDGAKFNKGKAINEGIKSIENPDNILLLDADIIVDDIDLAEIEEDTIYYRDRIMIRDYYSYERFERGESGFETESLGPLGYFQLFKYKKGLRYPESSNDAAWSDVRFFKRFKKKEKMATPVIHLGQDRKNWEGRKTEKFSRIGTYTICSYYFNYRNDERQKNNFIEFLKQFEGRYENMIVGIVDYGDIDFDIPCKSIIVVPDFEERIWSKEFLINRILGEVDSEYLIWIDGDLIYESLEWLDDIGSIADGKDFMQLYDRIEYLDEKGSVSESYKSIMSSDMIYGRPDRNTIDYLMGKGYKPGGSWMGKTDVLKRKKLYERMYVGGGDSIFLYGLLGIKGSVLESVKNGSGKIYQECIGWIDGFGRYTYGYLPCTVKHLYHGELVDRNYNGRYEALSQIEKNINDSSRRARFFRSVHGKMTSLKSKNIIVEVPKIDDTSGGINRMIKLAIELPHNETTSGGVKETMAFSKNLLEKYDVSLRFQKLAYSAKQNCISYPIKWSVGIPDESFPECDVCITYSDNPYLQKLVRLPQVKKVIIYMLSFGMCIEREMENVLTPGVVVTCSSAKLENDISKICPSVKKIGFGLEMSDMSNEKGLDRENFICLMFHNSENKRYQLAVEIADRLYDEGSIDGVVVFGKSEDYDKFRHPKGLVRFYPDADRKEISEIFNMSRCFLFPSVTEGLSLTPIESALCGCPAVICDGAIGEIFFDEKNCLISETDDKEELLKKTKKILNNYKRLSRHFQKNMEKIVDKHSWNSVIKEISKII